MGVLGRKRYIEFRLEDDAGNPVTGRLLSDLTVLFWRDDVNCADTLTLTELPVASGRYVLSYTPSSSGHDYLEIFDSITDIRRIDAEDIEESGAGDSNTVDVTQDTGGVGALKPPADLVNPEAYTLLVFDSFDWESGKTNPNYALSSTQLDSQGNWVTSPLVLVPGTYTFVMVNGSGVRLVLSAFRSV